MTFNETLALIALLTMCAFGGFIYYVWKERSYHIRTGRPMPEIERGFLLAVICAAVSIVLQAVAVALRLLGL